MKQYKRKIKSEITYNRKRQINKIYFMLCLLENILLIIIFTTNMKKENIKKITNSWQVMSLNC